MSLAKTTGWTTFVAVAGAAMLLPASAAAQGSYSQLRIDQMQPASAFSPFTRAEGPHNTYEEGIEYGFRVGMDYMFKPIRATVTGADADVDGTIYEEGYEITPVAHAILLDIGAALSPIDWLMFELNMPFAVFESGDEQIGDTENYLTVVSGQAVPVAGAGVGDLRIGGFVRPYESDEVDVGVGLRFWAPFASDKAYLSARANWMRFELVGTVAGEIEPATYGCTAGLAPLFFGGRDGDRLALSCGVLFDVIPELQLGLEPHFSAFTFVYRSREDTPELNAGEQVEVGSQVPGITDNTRVAFQVEPLAALRAHFGPFSVGVSAGPGFGNAPGTPQMRAMLNVAYTAIQEPVIEAPPPPDGDVDGIPDAYDQCPSEAGPESRQGCPDALDTDGDGIIAGDACPDSPGAKYEDPKANGCPDRDNDHVADPVDRCPIEPGTPAQEGCPKLARIAGLDGDGPAEFKVNPPIRFAKGSSELSGDALLALKEIVTTMRANPKLKQVSFAVGARKTGQDLTDKRAGAILKLLAQDQDFDSNRYEVVLNDKLESGLVTVKLVK